MGVWFYVSPGHEPGVVEWVGFNPDGQILRIESRETAEPWVYRREAAQ